MPLKNYGVRVGYPIRYTAETDDNSPHLQLHFSNSPQGSGEEYKAAINIKSSTVEESRLVYWFVRNLNNHPITSELESLSPGWHSRDEQSRQPALDYIRGNLLDLRDGAILKHNVPGEKNDIIDFISPVLDEAINRKAVIYLFGEQFPGGIHDVHMNQGNTGEFAKFNGVWQDGGILLHFPDDDHWEGIFLAFGVQKVHTNDETGDAISNVDFVKLIERQVVGPDLPPEKEEPVPVTTPSLEGKVYIRAALLNPFGPDPNTTGEPETVHLLNRTLQDLDLSGWSIVNNNHGRQLVSGSLAGQTSKGFPVPDCPLSNQGGTITLLDADDLKVDGVSYSKSQAKREGALVWFH